MLVIVFEAEGVAREGGVSAGEGFAREYLWNRTRASVADRKTAEGRGDDSAAPEQEQFTIADSDSDDDDDGNDKNTDGANQGDDTQKTDGPKQEETGDPLSRSDAQNAQRAEMQDERDLLPSLADRLFTCTVDLLFCAGFTLPDSVRGQSAQGEKVNVSAHHRMNHFTGVGGFRAFLSSFGLSTLILPNSM